MTTATKRLIPAAPSWSGSFAIPRLHKYVPTLTKSDCGMSAYATMALALDENGIPLVGDIKDTPEAVFGKSLQGWVDAQLRGCRLQADIHAWADQNQLGIKLTPRAALPLYVVGDVIESLNQVRDGLGWFVHDAIDQRQGLLVYGFSLYQMCISYRFEEADSDAEYVANCGHYYGIHVDDAADVTAEHIAQMREESERMPSDYVDLTGGHKHLLFWDPDNQPKRLTIKQAKASRRRLTPEQREIVNGAIALQELAQNDFEYTFEGEGEFIGALAMLAWDHRADWCREIVSDYEENAYNGGEAYECISQQTVAFDQPNWAHKLVLDTKNLIQRLVLLDQLLKHFPESE